MTPSSSRDGASGLAGAIQGVAGTSSESGRADHGSVSTVVNPRHRLAGHISDLSCAQGMPTSGSALTETRGPGSREPDPSRGPTPRRIAQPLNNTSTGGTPNPARLACAWLHNPALRFPRRLHADTSGIGRRSRFSRARIRCTPPVPAVLGRSVAMCGPGVSDMRSEVALQVQGLSAHGVPRFASPAPRSLTRRAAQSHGRSSRSDNGRTGGGRSLAAGSAIVWPWRRADKSTRTHEGAAVTSSAS